MSTTATRELETLIEPELGSLVELRHDLHAHPQLAYEETYAAAQVRRRLDALGIAYQAEVGVTGVVGWIEPTDPAARKRPAVALRADMDALPITEATGLPYASTHPGVMHACGHDGHTTILLGAATVLAKLRDQLPQPVKLLFQPAEEGRAGAAELVKAGALTERIGGVAAGRVYGLHGWPLLTVGHVETRPGPLMGSMDTFTITVEGRGGHGAYPHLTTDPLLAAAQIVSAAQSIAARHIDPTEPVVVSVCRFRAGEAFNVIAGSAELAGTIRALNEATRDRVHARLTTLAERTAEAMGCRATVSIRKEYPPVFNDPAATEEVLRVASAVLGEGRAAVLDRPTMAAEDFAFYGETTPSAFFFLGLRPADQTTYPNLHAADFDFNDAVIPVGVRLMCQLALQPLRGNDE